MSFSTNIPPSGDLNAFLIKKYPKIFGEQSPFDKDAKSYYFYYFLPEQYGLGYDHWNENKKFSTERREQEFEGEFYLYLLSFQNLLTSLNKLVEEYPLSVYQLEPGCIYDAVRSERPTHTASNLICLEIPPMYQFVFGKKEQKYSVWGIDQESETKKWKEFHGRSFIFRKVA